MIIIQDSKEKQPLEFQKVDGVSVEVRGLSVGDYAAEIDGIRDETVFERKSIPDLFGAFTEGYKRERAKILRANEQNMTYIIAIEGSATEVLKGYYYRKNGKLHEHKKSGIAMIRQLSSIQRKYGASVWFCSSRREMAWRIMEYFLVGLRNPEALKSKPNTE